MDINTQPDITGSQILVVDDEASLRETFEAFLVDEGHQVTLAEDHESAIRHLDKKCFDVAFVDIRLGNRSGNDILMEIQKRELLCPVVMMTGYPNADSAAAALRLHAFDYLSKPVLSKALIATTRRALQHKKRLEFNRQASNFYTSIHQNIQWGIMVVDKQLTVTFANEYIKQFFDYEPDDLQGKKLTSILAIDGFHEKLLAPSLGGQRPAIQFRTQMKSPSGSLHSVLIDASPISGPEGDSLGAVLSFKEENCCKEPERRDGPAARQSFHGIIGQCKALQELYPILEVLSKTDSTVLIRGETGTGKGMVTDVIHRIGPWGKNPAVAVACSALPESLLESELFGHVKGAFTGAIQDKTGRIQLAEGGTLFLDEIGDISPSIQLKLLKVIEEKQFERVGEVKPHKANVRFIAATNRDLKSLVKDGVFRSDLYYRLKVMEIILPPLREREGDIELLCDYFRQQYNLKFQKNIIPFSTEILHIFNCYDWPGNVRELKHAIEHAYILTNGDEIRPENLPPELVRDQSILQRTMYKKPVHLGEQDIRRALKLSGWNKSKAARILNIGRQTLYRKLELFNIGDMEY